MKNPQFTNRLIHEKSPYLLQHAHNPVDWYPWGEEAFREAMSLGKPIFLSIGYATCHWCHVMERESFSDIEIAKQMNEIFVNIKVDREELPEIDTLYMEFAQTMLAGAAGWPLNVVLTPDLKPFFASTYLPPSAQQGMIGVGELIEKIQTIWNSEEREQVISQASKIVEIYSESGLIEGSELPEEELIEESAELLFQLADASFGGLKGKPKFPIGYHINFLIVYSALSKDGRAIFLAEKTLDMMHKGGIYDHLAGGFSRYSTDEYWLVPHFEKMLYDNAILALSYCRGWQSMHHASYAEVCKESLDYILKQMTHAEGGFFSAEDSEVNGLEGEYYTWTFDELKEIIPEKDFSLFCKFYNATPAGNFHKKNILHTPLNVVEYAEKHQVDAEDVLTKIQQAKELLLKKRAKRERPFIDDKILTSWNGLMIHAMANVGAALNSDRFLTGAVRAARFIKMYLWQDHQLQRRWREGQADFHGTLSDYANMIRASLTLFECDCGTEWLAWAMELTNVLGKQFKATNKGAFYQTDGLDPNLLVQRCHFSDGAEPSGNAIHCENLLRLYQITAYDPYMTQAEDILRAAKTHLENYPPGYIYTVNNLLRFYDRQAPTIVIALNKKEEWRDEIFQLIHKHHIPHRAIVWRRVNEDLLYSKIPFLKEQHPIGDKTTVYICHKGVCKEPLNEIIKISQALKPMFIE